MQICYSRRDSAWPEKQLKTIQNCPIVLKFATFVKTSSIKGIEKVVYLFLAFGGKM